MPEFIMPGKEHPAFCALPPFAQGYVEAMFFTESGEPDSELYGAAFHSLSAGMVLDIEDDCASFENTHAALLAQAYAADYSEEQAGRDFWFTRNRHGVGYWDGDLPELLGKALTDAAHSYCEVHVYRGDDKQIYSS